VREIAHEGENRVRAHTAAFNEVVDKAIDTLKQRCRNALARGDEQANEAKLSKAVVAFRAVWNHQ